jgi:hypothetical protein
MPKFNFDVFNYKRYHIVVKILLIIGMVLLGLAVLAGLVFLASWAFMMLWNWLMPDLFGLKSISLYQAMGLLIIVKILFGVISNDK